LSDLRCGIRMQDGKAGCTGGGLELLPLTSTPA